jgi:hypothetical protein
MKWLCRFIGHKYTELDVLIAQIELKAHIAPVPKIICRRCGVDVIAEKLKEVA